MLCHNRIASINLGGPLGLFNLMIDIDKVLMI